MSFVSVVQHTSADYLGLMEDHFEGRGIRFKYFRPFTEGTPLPDPAGFGDGLVLLGGGPWGTAGIRDLPTLKQEEALAYAALMQGKPVIGIGVGAQILGRAAGGSSEAAPLRLEVGYGERQAPDALNGFLPERFPCISFLRDRHLPPSYARILARASTGHPVLFQVGENAFGFSFHPGFKVAIAEDLIMEFEESPADPAAALECLRTGKREIEDALVPIMTGLVQCTGLM